MFAVDILKCEKYDGRLRLAEIATKRDDVSRVLGYARAPPRAELLAHGQLRFVFGEAASGDLSRLSGCAERGQGCASSV